MDLLDQNCHERSSSAKATVGEPTKEASKGLAWWRPRRSNLADLSNTSSTSTSTISTSSPPQRQHRSKHGREDSPSSANRLLFDDPATEGEGGAAASSGPAARPFETQQKPPQPAGGKQLWTRGSRVGTAAPSPEGGDDHANTGSAAPRFLPTCSNGGSTVRRRRPQGDILGSSSGKLKSLKLAPTGSAKDATAATSTAAAAADSSPGTPVTTVGGSDASDSTWTNSMGRTKGRRHEQQREQQQQQPQQQQPQQQPQQRWPSAEQGRTPSKPPRPQREVRPVAAGIDVEVDTDRSTAAHGETAAVAAAQGGAGGSSSSNNGDGGGGTNAAGVAAANAGGRGRGSADGMVCDASDTEAGAAWEGMDDETAGRFSATTERSVVYDILAVDRGCGFCDTSIVPFPVEEGGQVAAARMRDLTSGQSEFLARRGFAAGLVSHFLEETNCEFRVLQGGTSCGMTAHQLQEAAFRLEEAFVPAVKRLRGRASMDVVLDSLFEGKDDAGEFVVRFEVSITRCHPEDMESSPAPALQECSRAIREAIREEGVPAQATHEVVFVGRPMWELVSPVLDFSARAKEKAASSG